MIMIIFISIFHLNVHYIHTMFDFFAFIYLSQNKNGILHIKIIIIIIILCIPIANNNGVGSRYIY